MKKLSKYDFFSIFILLGPFLDVASFLGIGGTLSLSILVRTLFLGVLLVLLFRKKESWKNLGIILGVGLVLGLYSIFYLQSGVVDSASSILKLLYLPIVLLYFKHYSWKDDKSKILEIVLFTYLGTFLLSYIFDIGADAYLETDGKTGFKGLFSSINEFSAIVVSVLFYVGTNLKKKKKYFPIVCLIVFSLITSLLIGTKVLLGGILFTVLYLIWLERDRLFFKQDNKVKIGIVLTSVIILLGGCFLFTKTRTYQNMKIQQNFFKVDNVFSYEFLNKVVFNDRLTFLEENFEFYLDQPLEKKIFGIGISEYDIKMVELDVFDILFRYGIVGFVFFVSTFVCWIPWKKLEIEELIALILLIGVACTSGHVLFYPAVCIYFGCLSCKVIESNSKKKLIKNKR